MKEGFGSPHYKKMEEKKGWKVYEGKKVFIILKSGRKYSGTVLEVEGEGALCFISIRDKFDKNVSFFSSEIEVLQEERE